MTTLAIEKLTDLLASDAMRLNEFIEAHWLEVENYKNIIKFEPDLDRYRKLELADCLHIVVMRAEDGAMVGYSVHVIMKAHPYCPGLIAAEDNVHYLVPALRGSGAHEEMRRFALKTMKGRGVQFVTAHAKADHPHDASLRRVGFKPLNMVYGLDLTTWE